MPILIVALVALGAWIAIGVLLGSAVLLEQHDRKKTSSLTESLLSNPWECGHRSHAKLNCALLYLLVSHEKTLPLLLRSQP